MKTLRRCFLALTLAVALSAGAAAAERSTARFSDWDTVSNQSEVAMLTSLGLFSGYQDNTFRPNNCITRAETAKLISYLQVDSVPAYQTNSFTDTANSWAKDYIEYCAQQGILAGYNGKFRPDDYVTVRELTKVLLVVLGQDSSRYVGSGWAEAVDEDAEELGIYDGYTGSRELYVTRQQACQLISNALQCPVQVAKTDGEKDYVLDSMMAPMSLLQYRFAVIPVVGVVEANAQADLRDDTPLDGDLIHIAGYSKDFRVTSDVANDMSLLGRTVTVYARFFSDQNRVYGLPTLRDSGYTGEGLRAEELKIILLYGQMSVSSTTSYYVNYERTDSSVLDQLEPDDRITVLDYQGDNVIDRILVTRVISEPEEPETPADGAE